MRCFSFSNFDAERRRNLANDFKAMAILKMAIAVTLSWINPFLGAWIGAAGLMSAGLAGGLRLPGVISRSNFRRAKSTSFRVKVIRHVNVHNHARAYRSAPRSALTHASEGDGSDGGDSESDSGDPSDPPGLKLSFPVTQFQNFDRKQNNFLSPWRLSYAPNCWCLPCCQNQAKGVSA